MKQFNISKEGIGITISIVIDINEICKLVEETDFAYSIKEDKY
jgi:hypothetical protein